MVIQRYTSTFPRTGTLVAPDIFPLVLPFLDRLIRH
jgi:hypothetical protein